MLSERRLDQNELDPGIRPEPSFVTGPPIATEPKDIFVDATIEQATRHLGRWALECAASFLIHVAIIVVLVILPVFFCGESSPANSIGSC